MIKVYGSSQYKTIHRKVRIDLLFEFVMSYYFCKK